MLINLKTSPARTKTEHVSLTLTERLPSRIAAPAILDCSFSIEPRDRYYLFTLEVKGEICLTCQRCMQEFNEFYLNKTILAISNSDEQGEKLMESYEFIVATNNQIDLDELVTDELILYTPEFHADINDCDHEIDQFFSI